MKVYSWNVRDNFVREKRELNTEHSVARERGQWIQLKHQGEGEKHAPCNLQPGTELGFDQSLTLLQMLYLLHRERGYSSQYGNNELQSQSLGS